MQGVFGGVVLGTSATCCRTKVASKMVCSGKPMIITTNLTVKEMRETQNMDEKRIYDRVLQNCQPICVKGENKRREKSRQNRSELEQIFQE